MFNRREKPADFADTQPEMRLIADVQSIELAWIGMESAHPLTWLPPKVGAETASGSAAHGQAVNP